MADHEGFSEAAFSFLKENLTLNLLSYCFNQMLETTRLTAKERSNIRKHFIDIWKRGAKKITQKSLEDLNKSLLDNNVDFMNVIVGEQFATTEDYQKTYNDAIKTCEKLYWKMMNDSDNLEEELTPRS